MKINKRSKRKSIFSIGGSGITGVFDPIGGRRIVALDGAIDTLKSVAAEDPRRRLVITTTKDGKYVVQTARDHLPVPTKASAERARYEAKALRFKRHGTKGASLTRATFLLKDAESTETTAGIARSLDENVRINRDRYHQLFEGIVKD